MFIYVYQGRTFAQRCEFNEKINVEGCQNDTLRPDIFVACLLKGWDVKNRLRHSN